MRSVRSDDAPAPVGPYSQAVVRDGLIFVSGQIPLDPQTMELVNDSIEAEIHQVFKNLRAVCVAAGSDLAGIAKLNVFLTDLSHFPKVNKIMAEYFSEPYPARAAIGVAQLPKGARVEADAVVVLD